MRFAVIGAGGIGTLVAVLLARGGAGVVLLARPSAAAAIRERGGRIEGPLAGSGNVHFDVVDDAAALRADVAIVCVKAHQLEGVVASCAATLAAARSIVLMQNGIPWWYFNAVPGVHAGRQIAAVDPHGRLAAAFPPAKVVGCVVEAAGQLLEPGVVRSGAAARFTLGAPDNTPGPGSEELAAALRAGGAEAIPTTDIRAAVWKKLLGNISMPMSALTRATPRELCDDPVVYAFLVELLAEILQVAAAYGVELGITPQARLEQTRAVGMHPPSMLQDLLAGRKLELDALTGAALELGALAGVPMPSTQRLDALTRLLETSLLERHRLGRGGPPAA
jgi:2-dehydropantoate 2-reductase